MDILLQDILADLLVVSSINEGDTLTIKNGNIQVIVHNGSGAERMWKGESRITTINIIDKKIVYAIEYSSSIMESIYLHSLPKLDSLQITLFNKRLCSLQRIQTGLEEAKKGIQKIARTYHDDTNITSRASTLNGNIDFHVHTIKDKITALRQQIVDHNKNNNTEDSD